MKLIDTTRFIMCFSLNILRLKASWCIIKRKLWIYYNIFYPQGHFKCTSTAPTITIHTTLLSGNSYAVKYFNYLTDASPPFLRVKIHTPLFKGNSFFLSSLVLSWFINTVQGSNRVVGKIFRSCLQRPWGQSSLYTMGTETLPGVKRPGRGANHPHLPTAEVKERKELYPTYHLFFHGRL